MPKKLYKLDSQIKDLLSNQPDGIRVEELQNLLGPETNRRTLERHLAKLTNAGAISAEGRTRARRYRPPAPQPEATEAILPLSPSATAVQKQIKRPMAM